MSIPLFKTLIAISDHGSYSAAADHICISHAAVGQQMKRLEGMFEVTLFDRSEKSPRLNQLGQALIPKAKKVIYDYETIFDDLVGDAQFIGELTLGAVPTTIRELIPRSIKKLMKNYPDLYIRVVPGLGGDLLDQVSRGAIDAAIMSKPESIDKAFHWRQIAEEELVLVTAPEIIGNDPIKILNEMPYIRHNRRAAAGIVAEQWLSQNRVDLRETMVTDSIETLTSMVTHNLGVAIVPNLCMPGPIFAELRKISLGSSSIPRVLGLLTRKDCSKLRLVNRLQEEIEIVLEQK
ncbi:MAG: LysR family transcriptional regulator [Cocleimonas sp.]